MRETILIVAAHPDDELLGAGATLRLHVERGNDVHVLILGQGSIARKNGSAQEVAFLQEQARTAGAIIGFKEIRFASFPDNAFDTVNLLTIVKKIEYTIENIGPTIVYTHHANDLNLDHQLTFQAVLTASRPCSAYAPRDIYAFETLSSTEWQCEIGKSFHPNIYVNIEGSPLGKKLEALAAYASELRPYPHSRSLKGVEILARYRGLECGLQTAEAFYLVRSIRS